MGRLCNVTYLAAAWLGVSVLMPMEASALTNPFFARHPVSNSNLSAFTKWTSLMPRYEKQKREADSECAGNASCSSQTWEKLLAGLQNKPVMAKIAAVNSFFNKAPYVSDQQNFGQEDYWQTPYELMERGGDCEDYAIAKYISLKRLGVPESSMRILIVQDQNLGGIMHALLEVRIGGVPYILDNQAQQVIAAAKIFHYQPIYAINSYVWWAYV
jgi:predicted transglutaminase-like cysteine proteinase